MEGRGVGLDEIQAGLEEGFGGLVDFVEELLFEGHGG
jgi:hypothetical protein